MAIMSKKDILKVLEKNKISNFQTPEQKIEGDLEYAKWLEAKKNKTDLSGTYVGLTRNKTHDPADVVRAIAKEEQLERFKKREKEEMEALEKVAKAARETL
jgi:hypothetical protein